MRLIIQLPGPWQLQPAFTWQWGERWERWAAARWLPVTWQPLWDRENPSAELRLPVSWPQTPALLTAGPGLDQPRVRSSISGQFTLTSRWRLGRRHPPGGEEGPARTRSVTHRRLTPLYIPTTSTDQGRGSAQALREPWKYLELPLPVGPVRPELAGC